MHFLLVSVFLSFTKQNDYIHALGQMQQKKKGGTKLLHLLETYRKYKHGRFLGHVCTSPIMPLMLLGNSGCKMSELKNFP